MNCNPLYEKIIESKTGIKIPVTFNGKTIESRYNPENDVQRYISTNQLSGDYIILLGIGSGLLLNKISELNPDKFFLAIENTETDIHLIENCNNLKKKNNIKTTTIQNLEQDLLNSFFPVFYNKIQVIEQKPWALENNAIINEIYTLIQATLNSISADYSVQVHFGKIWTHNILSNINHISDNYDKIIDLKNKKKAIVLAAGPSLDTYFDLIRNKSNEYFIIATDTAFQTMIKQNIQVDAVVSLDGQYISSNHFFNINTNDTLFFIDLCGNSSAVNKIADSQNKIVFFNSGHPLSNIISNDNPNSFINLFSGAGTVTIAALDLVIKLGFKNIELYGADYGFINNKPYMSGTYLENLYNSNSQKISTSENQYSKLLYRTELIKKNDKITTEVLDNYRKSMEKYLINNNIKFEYKENVYYLNNPYKTSVITIIKSFDSKNWYKNYLEKLQKHQISVISDLRIEDYSLLPLMSYLKNHDNNSKTNINDLFHKAIEIISR